MSFDVAADAYGRFMGRFSEPLARSFAALAGVGPGERVLDVGCGPGALTSELVARVGDGSVSAIDPSEPFVAAARQRFPALDVRLGSAEALPYDDGAFDAALAQLVVHFMADPVAGLREMGRVVRPGGTVAACVWDHAGGGGPLAVFWRAVGELDEHAHDESGLAGAREGHLAELFRAAGLTAVRDSTAVAAVTYADLDEWWEPYTLGVGPAGEYVAGLDDAARDRLRHRCAELLPPPPFTVTATAWCAVGIRG
jgi:SAM-dependent methyltransferase